MEAIDRSLRSDILDHLAKVDPFRFEQVVVDLLFAMGYGGSREEAARVTKKSGDEGISNWKTRLSIFLFPGPLRRSVPAWHNHSISRWQDAGFTA